MSLPNARSRLVLTAAVLLSGATAASVDAQGRSACGDSIRVTFSPARPVQGTLFLVQLSGVPQGVLPEGRVAGEPLHFRPAPPGRTGAGRLPGWRALAAVPIDSAESLGAVIACSSRDVSDSLRVDVPVASGAYALEHLRVAPEFSAPPDSALAARLALEAKRAAAVSTGSHDTPRMWTLPFVAPRASRVTSRFGGGREFNGSVTSRHMGTDYAGATGALVKAANRGVVRLVDRFFLGGNVVYVDHGEGLVSAYLHLSRQLVAAGDTVARGAVIGRVGATGRVTGPHLHFIMRYGAISVDPQRALALLGDATPPTRRKGTTKGSR